LHHCEFLRDAGAVQLRQRRTQYYPGPGISPDGPFSLQESSADGTSETPASRRGVQRFQYAFVQQSKLDLRHGYIRLGRLHFHAQPSGSGGGKDSLLMRHMTSSAIRTAAFLTLTAAIAP